MKKGSLILALTGGVAMIAAACNSGFLGGLGGSGGGESVAAFLPSDITLEIDELSDSDDVSGKTANSDLLVNGVPAYNRTLRATGAIMHAFQRTARRAFALGAAINGDFESPDQTQVSGTLTVDGQEVSYKADFAAFDFDGDGQPDGSGTATQDPVAMRMWMDRGNGYERFLTALVTQRPSADTLGAGEMVFKPSAARATASSDLQVRVKWDRTDSAHKWNEAFVAGKVRQNYTMSIGHQRVDVRTATDGSVEKTVRSNSNFTSSPFGLENFAFSSHWLRGSGFVLISGEATGGTSQVSFSNICVSLADQAVDSSGACDNYDTQDFDFLTAPTGNEADFPADFETAPTF
ncbi:MAG: hypothetical protein ACE5E1_09785 [Phycisphaerae bacterium]